MTSAEFMAVVRATSAVRIEPENAIVTKLSDPEGDIEVVIYSQYEDTPSVKGIPSDLIFRLRGISRDLDSGAKKLADRASTCAAIASFAANAAIDELQLELVFDCSRQSDRRPFMQNLLPLPGPPRSSRVLGTEAFVSVLGAVSSHPDAERMSRALAQYEIALRHAVPGHEIMALAHLWIVAETLTPIFREREIVRAGGRDALLQAWGIVIQKLDSSVRERRVLEGNHDLYSQARQASDGFEHGYLEISKIRALSSSRLGELWASIRRAILNALEIDDPLGDRNGSSQPSPLPCIRTGRRVQAELVASEADLAAGPLEYPMLSLTSEIQEVRHHPGGRCDIDYKDEYRFHVAAGASFENIQVEIVAPDPGNQ